MHDFISVKIPDSIIGLGAINKLGELVKKFEACKILVVTDTGIVEAGIVDKIKASLEKARCNFDVYDKCEPEPLYSSLIKLADRARAGKYDLLIGVGGGSVMDATKVASQLAFNEGMVVDDLMSGKAVKNVLPKVLVPTTAGTGSEWSNVAVVYDDKADKEVDMTKVYISAQNFANAVVIDPEITINLPQRITADTGMDALTHAIEAYTCRLANVISDMFARTAIKLIAQNLRLAYSKGKNDTQARYNMSVAASLAMSASVMSGLGMAHFANGPLGKKAKVSHGAACTLMLPHVMKFNLVANPAKFAQIAEMMGENVDGLSVMDAAQRSIEAVKRLAGDLGMQQNLAGTKMSDTDIVSMVESVHKHTGPVINMMNTRDVTPDDTKRLFLLAIRGNS
jgi:alcohol dehydrogenase